MQESGVSVGTQAVSSSFSASTRRVGVEAGNGNGSVSGSISVNGSVRDSKEKAHKQTPGSSRENFEARLKRALQHRTRKLALQNISAGYASIGTGTAMGTGTAGFSDGAAPGMTGKSSRGRSSSRSRGSANAATGPAGGAGSASGSSSSSSSSSSKQPQSPGVSSHMTQTLSSRSKRQSFIISMPNPKPAAAFLVPVPVPVSMPEPSTAHRGRSKSRDRGGSRDASFRGSSSSRVREEEFFPGTAPIPIDKRPSFISAFPQSKPGAALFLPLL